MSHLTKHNAIPANFFWDINVRFLSWECWDFWRRHGHFRRFPRKSEVFRRHPKSAEGEVIEKTLIHKIRDREEGIVIYSFYTWFSFLIWVWVNIFLEIVSSKTATTHIFQSGVRNWSAGVSGRESWQVYDLTIFSSLFTSHPSGRYSASSHILALLHNLRRIKEPVLTILCWLPKHQRWLFYCISAWEAAFSFAQRADVLFERSNEGLQIWSSGCVVSRQAASKWNWVWSQEVWGTAERTWRTKKETKHSQQLSTGVTAFNFIF